MNPLFAKHGGPHPSSAMGRERESGDHNMMENLLHARDPLDAF